MALDRAKVIIKSVLEANFAGEDGGGLAAAGESEILLGNGAVFRKNYGIGNGGAISAAGRNITIGEYKASTCSFYEFQI